MTYRRRYGLELSPFPAGGAPQVLIGGEPLVDADTVWISGWLAWAGPKGSSPRLAARAYFPESDYGHVILQNEPTANPDRFSLDLDTRGASRIEISISWSGSLTSTVSVMDGIAVVSYD